jgi:glutamine---fructose-6-phosphate transaminase (isomerizing)
MMPVSGSPVSSAHTHREILSQPVIWRSSSSELLNSPVFQLAAKQTSDSGPWLFVGCGSSFYLAETAAASWTMMTGRPARALPASELLLFPKLAQLDSKPLRAVVISRSGRTSEALRAAEILASTSNAVVIGLTCSQDSELAKLCQITLALPGADEKSMVMTRSFTSMLLALLHLQAAAAELPSFAPAAAIVADGLSAHLQLFDTEIGSFVGSQSFEDYIYLAQGPFIPIAREAALKITEMSCSYAQAYHTLEFRHGPKAVVAPNTLITFLLSESGMQAESEVLLEMKELGGTIVAVCNQASDLVRRHSDLVLELEAHAPELALLAPFTVPPQLLGFHTAVKKGLNPDEPRNLSRVVILD